jgi:purine nucleosidase
MTRQAVILDTDIGTNVDDAFAVALALSAPELDLIAITLSGGDMQVRSVCLIAVLDRLKARFERIPRLGKGAAQPLTRGKEFRWLGTEGRGVEVWSPELLARVQDDGVSLIADEAMRSPGDAVLIAIGPLTNVATALRRHPELGSAVRRIFCMGGACLSLDGRDFGYENNFGVDPVAARSVLNSGIPMTVLGTNVTRRISLSGRDLRRLGESKGQLERLLTQMARNWLEGMGRKTVLLHDPVAVAAAIDDSFLEFARAVPVFEEKGGALTGRMAWTRDDSSCIRVATAIDTAGFWRLFNNRLRLDLAARAGSMQAQQELPIVQ